MDASKPFRVRTSEGELRSEHDNKAQAEDAANRANRDAEALAIKTRYRALDEGPQAA